MSSPSAGNNESYTATRLAEDEDEYELEELDKDIDNGQGGYLSPSAANNLYLNDQDHDDKDAVLPSDNQSRTWRVDPNFRQYHFKGKLRRKTLLNISIH